MTKPILKMTKTDFQYWLNIGSYWLNFKNIG